MQLIKPQGGELCTPTLTRGGVGQGKGASPNTPMGVGLPGECHYGSRTHNKKPPVTYRFLNLSVILDLFPGVFV